ncbi:hypothetical protein [Haloarchaeobius amylolyticus]|uniref:hypothetical protein n=1 Tax=Haloarchaeobius amylolyticus TaxID=1198296 RepID=UPI0022707F71|nr:hypothetical protein [Haloarchaeobius amylolyticus]
MSESQSSGESRFSGNLPPLAYVIFAAATLLGLAHHIDHVIRGNHVGWPITSSVNPFTYSLLIYPLVITGFVGSLTGLTGERYWSLVMLVGGGMLVFFHLSPWAVEPPGDVILPYANPLFGYLAFAVLLALILVVFVGAAYSLAIWYRGTTTIEY